MKRKRDACIGGLSWGNGHHVGGYVEVTLLDPRCAHGNKKVWVATIHLVFFENWWKSKTTYASERLKKMITSSQRAHANGDIAKGVTIQNGGTPVPPSGGCGATYFPPEPGYVFQASL